jgi:PTS system mannose-specific IID component
VRLPTSTLALVFARSFFLQAAWNRRGMQNLGFAYAIDPALAELYADPEKLAEARRRHLGFFNCQPYLAAAILGGAIHHEEKIARGEEPATAVVQYKSTLQGPLAAIGDGFFWTALRPFFGAAGAVAALTFGLWGVAFVLVVYNVVHLSMRAWFLKVGYDKGDGVVAVIARRNLPVHADRLRAVGAGLSGLSGAVWMTHDVFAEGVEPQMVGFAVAVLGYLGLSRGGRVLPLSYAVVVLGTLGAFLATRIRAGF